MRIRQLHNGDNSRSYIFGLFDILSIVESTLQPGNQRIIAGQLSQTRKVLPLNPGPGYLARGLEINIEIIQRFWPRLLGELGASIRQQTLLLRIARLDRGVDQVGIAGTDIGFRGSVESGGFEKGKGKTVQIHQHLED